jgi:hypothetical protein
MKKLWSVLFAANLVPACWLYFLSGLRVRIPFEKWSHLEVYGELYAKKVFTYALIAHVVLLLIYSNARRTRILYMLPFPNKTYWLSSPDKQLDALSRLQDVIAFAAFFVFGSGLFTQFFIFFANIYSKQMKPQYLSTYYGVVGLLGVCLIALSISQFSRSEA